MSKPLPVRSAPKKPGLKLLGTFIDQSPYNVFMLLDASEALAPDAKVVHITLREAARYKLGRLIY